MLDKQKLDEVNRTFKVAFLEALGQAARWSDQLCDVVPMSKGELKLKWGARTSGVHEWLDERIKRSMRVYDTQLVAKKWANGFEVDGADLEDDDSGLRLYRGSIAEMADDFAEHKHQLIIDRLNGGFAGAQGLAYDGQFFFDSDHVDDPAGGAQSNVTNAVLSATAFRNARSAMRKIKKPTGLIANLEPDKIIVPVELEGTAQDIFQVEKLASGATNPNYNAVSVIVEPRLTSATAWFLWDSKKPLKPFIFGNRRAVGMRTKGNGDPNSDAAFDRDKYEWGGDGRYNAAFGFWHSMYGSTGA